MADFIDELIQNGSVDPTALANQLRRQEQYGRVGAASGSKVLGPLGASAQQEAMAGAEGVGDRRTAAYNTDQKNSLESWKAQMAAMAKQADIQARQNEGRLNRGSRERIAGMRGQQMLDAIGARNAAKAGLGGPAGATLDGYKSTLGNLEELANTAREARGMSGRSNTGLMSATSVIPGSPARNLEAFIEPLKSMEALDKLSQLRKEAAAMGQKGSGLGQVTEREISLLMSARKSLDLAQDEKQFDKALDYLEKQYRSSMRNIQKEIDKIEASESNDAAFVAGASASSDPADEEFDNAMDSP